MANIFSLPYRPAFDNASGLLIPGAQVWFTEQDTDDPAEVYSDEALSSLRTNPVIADGIGKIPPTYTSDVVNYRVRVYDKNAEVGVDTPIEEFNPWIPGLFLDADALSPVADSAASSAAAAVAAAGAATDSANAGATSATEAAASAAAAAAVLTTFEAALPADFTIEELASGLPLNAKWFGMDPANSASANDTAIAAAIAYAKTLITTGYGYSNGGPSIYIPYGAYNLSATVSWDFQLTIFGDAGAIIGGTGTVLNWTANVTGLKVLLGGSASIIRNLYLDGAYSGTESEAHGIHVQAISTLRDVFIDNFAGDGVFIDGTGGSPSNLTRLYDVWAQDCRNGLYVFGADSNACIIQGGSFVVNRQWGIWDSSFLGNTYIGCHAAGNGYVAGTIPVGATYSGNRYYVMPGQAVGASTNAPSGTTASNTWWGYISAGGTGTGIVAWVSGTIFREGGPYKTDNANARNVFLGCYSEGSQNPSQFTHPTLVLGGLHGSPIRGDAGVILGGEGLLALSITGWYEPDSVSNFVSMGHPSANYGLGYTRGSDTYSLQAGSQSFIWTANNLGNDAFWPFEITYGTTTRSVGGHRMNFPNGYGIADKKRFPATAAPTLARVVGDIDENTAPTATTPLKWITTVAGTPGTQILHYPYLRANPTVGVGYVTGAGGAQTQGTSKSTAVTLDKVCGQITMHNASLADNTKVSFTLNNSTLAATDCLQVNVASGAADAAAYTVRAAVTGAGVAKVTLKNDASGGALGEAVVINFAVIKAVAA